MISLPINNEGAKTLVYLNTKQVIDIVYLIKYQQFGLMNLLFD